jgi:hypothetical protein
MVGAILINDDPTWEGFADALRWRGGDLYREAEAVEVWDSTLRKDDAAQAIWGNWPQPLDPDQPLAESRLAEQLAELAGEARPSQAIVVVYHHPDVLTDPDRGHARLQLGAVALQRLRDVRRQHPDVAGRFWLVGIFRTGATEHDAVTKAAELTAPRRDGDDDGTAGALLDTAIFLKIPPGEHLEEREFATLRVALDLARDERAWQTLRPRAGDITRTRQVHVLRLGATVATPARYIRAIVTHLLAQARHGTADRTALGHLVGEINGLMRQIDDSAVLAPATDRFVAGTYPALPAAPDPPQVAAWVGGTDGRLHDDFGSRRAAIDEALRRLDGDLDATARRIAEQVDRLDVVNLGFNAGAARDIARMRETVAARRAALIETCAGRRGRISEIRRAETADAGEGDLFNFRGLAAYRALRADCDAYAADWPDATLDRLAPWAVAAVLCGTATVFVTAALQRAASTARYEELVNLQSLVWRGGPIALLAFVLLAVAWWMERYRRRQLMRRAATLAGHRDDLLRDAARVANEALGHEVAAAAAAILARIDGSLRKLAHSADITAFDNAVRTLPAQDRLLRDLPAELVPLVENRLMPKLATTPPRLWLREILTGFEPPPGPTELTITATGVTANDLRIRSRVVADRIDLTPPDGNAAPPPARRRVPVDAPSPAAGAAAAPLAPSSPASPTSLPPADATATDGTGPDPAAAASDRLADPLAETLQAALEGRPIWPMKTPEPPSGTKPGPSAAPGGSRARPRTR